MSQEDHRAVAGVKRNRTNQETTSNDFQEHIEDEQRRQEKIPRRWSKVSEAHP